MQIVRDKVALEVLEEGQRNLAPLLTEFSTTHILVWGTAISLQLGHRRSIDFDLFCFGLQGSGTSLMQRIESSGCMFDLDTAPRFRYSDEEQSELTLFFQWIKVQLIDFSRNPFGVAVSLETNTMLCGGIASVSLLDLGALKIYAMMYRKKIKDIVDLYMILQVPWLYLFDIVQRAEQIFGRLCNPESSYEAIFDDERDETEKVDRLIDFPPEMSTIFASMRMEVDKLLLDISS